MFSFRVKRQIESASEWWERDRERTMEPGSPGPTPFDPYVARRTEKSSSEFGESSSKCSAEHPKMQQVTKWNAVFTIDLAVSWTEIHGLSTTRGEMGNYFPQMTPKSFLYLGNGKYDKCRIDGHRRQQPSDQQRMTRAKSYKTAD